MSLPDIGRIRLQAPIALVEGTPDGMSLLLAGDGEGPY